MSDGPHSTLNMRRAWKKTAERADNTAYTLDEVGEALRDALERDWFAVGLGRVRTCCRTH